MTGASAAIERSRAALAAGRVEAAWADAQRALADDPENLEAMLLCARILRRAGRHADAAKLYESILRHHPDLVEAATGLGAAYGGLGRYGEAVRRLEGAVARAPGFHVAWSFLGEALVEQGRIEEAIAAFERSLAIRPMNAVAYSKYLFYATFHPAFDAARLFALNRAWGVAVEAAMAAGSAAAASLAPATDRVAALPPAADGRLRVGYLSDEFYDRVTARFLEPVLAGHDRRAVAVTCYSTGPVEDAVSARLRDTGAAWRRLPVREDEAAAAIRADSIDILVLCTSYRATSRTILAYRPAPIQVCYSNLVSSTGLAAADYLLTEDATDPPGAEAYYTEKLVRLTNRNIYAPPRQEGPDAEAPPAPGPLPCGAEGTVTFASFNNLGKVTRDVVALWAAVLKAVPGSRLVMKSVDRLRDVGARQHFAQAFAGHGIGLDRLDFLYGDVTRTAHLARYRDVDIALDPFPCNGGTTSCESLWMGVPFVTLAGDTFMGRQGINYLTKMGLSDLVAQTPEAYVIAARQLAGDRPRLAGLRRNLRGLAEARLFEPVAHVGELETAFRAMQARRVAGLPPAAMRIHGGDATIG